MVDVAAVDVAPLDPPEPPVVELVDVALPVLVVDAVLFAVDVKSLPALTDCTVLSPVVEATVDSDPPLPPSEGMPPTDPETVALPVVTPSTSDVETPGEPPRLLLTAAVESLPVMVPLPADCVPFSS